MFSNEAWQKVPTWIKVILMVLSVAAVNAYGVSFHDLLFVVGFFFCTGLLSTLLWDKKHSWYFCFGVGLAGMFATGLNLYLLMPLKFGSKIDNGLIVIGMICLIVFYGFGLLLGVFGSMQKQKPTQSND